MNALARRQSCRGAKSATQRRTAGLRTAAPMARRTHSLTVAPKALLGGGGEENKGDKKFLSREEEPEEYWASEGERKGGNPFKDPLAIIGILAILFPFFLVLVAAQSGLIDFSVYR